MIARALLVAFALGLAAAPVHAQERPFNPAAAADTLGPPKTNALRALAEITVVNAGVWSYNRYIRAGGGEGFKIGWGAWNENFENGFDWDPNNFSTNQFAHPYHGSLYFNAGRSNGYDYWSSLGFSFVGSFQWEFLGEARHPSINDWVNTSVGGTALGEMTHRLANRVRDNTATGGSRVASEFGGLLVDPIGALTRLVDGDMFHVQPNPVDHIDSKVHIEGTFGGRTVYEERIPQKDTTGFTAQFKFVYGDPFQDKFEKPYDVFNAYVRINGNDIKKMGQVDVAGMLVRKQLANGRNSQHLLTVLQNYDYVNNRAFELGGQSVTAGLISRFGSANPHYKVNTTIGVTGILLGATKSDYANQTARSYDYGPGWGARLSASLTKDDWELMRVAHQEFVIHSVNGNRGDHYLSISSVGIGLPLTRWAALDAEYQLYLANRHYADFPDVAQRSPQILFGVRTRL